MNAQSHRRCLGTDEGVPMLPSDATFRCCVLMRAFRRQFHTTAGIQQSCHCSLHQSCYALCGHIVRGVTPTLICEVMTPTSASLTLLSLRPASLATNTPTHANAAHPGRAPGPRAQAASRQG